MEHKIINSFTPDSRKQWRQWLKNNHASAASIWLIYYKKDSGVATITYSEAVDEALCFGWIDSTKRTIDKYSYVQLFTKRKAKSIWSGINKAKIEKLIETGLMTSAGYKSIEIAKENGSWTILDEVEALTIPPYLEKQFNKTPYLRAYFGKLSKSAKKEILYKLVIAKRPETRQKRMQELLDIAKTSKGK